MHHLLQGGAVNPGGVGSSSQGGGDVLAGHGVTGQEPHTAKGRGGAREGARERARRYAMLKWPRTAAWLPVVD